MKKTGSTKNKLEICSECRGEGQLLIFGEICSCTICGGKGSGIPEQFAQNRKELNDKGNTSLTKDFVGDCCSMGDCKEGR